MVRYTDATYRSVATIVSPKVWTCVISYFTAWLSGQPYRFQYTEIVSKLRMVIETLRQLHVRSQRWIMFQVVTDHCVFLVHWYAIYEPCC
jgi:hypothetical protein